jgi:hypothetical protein
MITIRPEGVDYYLYFPKGEVPATPEIGGLTVYRLPEAFMLQQLPATQDFRLVLERSVLMPTDALVYYLHWDDGLDLEALDRRVLDGIIREADFAQAAKTLYQGTICDRCRTMWDTLVMPTGEIYPGLPVAFAHAKVARHAIIRHCPACGARFRQLVVKIFGRAASPEDRSTMQ